MTEFRFRPKLPGLPGPAPKVISRMVRTPGERIDIAYAPDPRNRHASRLSTFRASFTCRPVAGGVEVTRVVGIGFPPVVRWILEPLLRRRWQASVERELVLAKDLLERT